MKLFNCFRKKDDVPSLKERYKDSFLIGAAITSFDFDRKNPRNALIKKHFNLIVAENCTKPMYICKNRGKFDFSLADKFIDFAKENDLQFRWHTLVWHSQSPDWLFENEDGTPVTKEQAMENLKCFIQTVVTHNKGKGIHSYDVVNECLSDKTFELRNKQEFSRWFDLIGPEYIDLAFKWAHEADPDALLVINDYNLEYMEGKRNAMYNLVKGMKERGVPVHGIGIQMHIDKVLPAIEEIEKTIDLFASLGVEVFVTEMEVSLFDVEDKRLTQPKEEMEKSLEIQSERYKALFDMFERKYAEKKLNSVILWGIDDRFSWKNGFPVRGRVDAPLLFDRKFKPKECFYRIVEKQ